MWRHERNCKFDFVFSFNFVVIVLSLGIYKVINSTCGLKLFSFSLF